MAPKVAETAKGSESFQRSLQILQAQCQLIKSLSTLPLITNNIPITVMNGFTNSFNKFLLESIQTNKTGELGTLTIPELNNGLLFQNGLEICTPLALFTTMAVVGEEVKELALVAAEVRINKLEFLFRNELDFKDIMHIRSKDECYRFPVDNKNYLISLLRAKSFGGDLRLTTYGETFELFKKYDIYDEYIRNREAQFEALQSELVELPEEDTIFRAILQKSLEVFQSWNYQRALAFKSSDTSDVLINSMNPETWSLFEAWMKKNLPEKMVERVSSDPFLYNSAHCWYPWVTDKRVMLQIIIIFFVDFLLDDLSEKCDTAVFDIILDMLDSKPVSEERWEVCPKEFRHGVKLYVQETFEFHKLLPKSDFIEINKEWVLSMKATDDARVNAISSVDDYFKMRFKQVGGYVHIAILAASKGTTLKALPEQVVDDVLRYAVTENDYYSLAKEILDIEQNPSCACKNMNLIFSYKKLYPELDYQQILYKLEPLKESNMKDILKLKGPEYDYLYMSSIGVAYMSQHSKRYLKTNIVCNDT